MLVSKAFSQHEERTLARKHALQLMYQGEILKRLRVSLSIMVSLSLKRRVWASML